MSVEEMPPAEPGAKGRSSCLRAAGISCISILVAIVAITVWIYFLVTRNPVYRHAYNQAILVAECQLQLQDRSTGVDIGDALERYARRNGRYPSSLEELYPNFLDNRALLYCPADKVATGASSYKYIRPALNAPGETPVVICRNHPVLADQEPWMLTLYKNGKVIIRPGQIKAQNAGSDGKKIKSPSKPSPQTRRKPAELDRER
jgi:hypothetical protein